MGCRSVLNRLLKRQAQSTEVSDALAEIERAEFDGGAVTVAPGQSRTSALRDSIAAKRSLAPPQDEPEPDPPSHADDDPQAPPDDVPGPDEIQAREARHPVWQDVIQAIAGARCDDLVCAIVDDLYSQSKAKHATFLLGDKVTHDLDRCEPEMERQFTADPDAFKTRAARVWGKISE